MTKLRGNIVPIGERVLVQWSHDHLTEAKVFLDSLDPKYFSVIADAVARIEGKREEQFAAMQVRIIRDQAAEMLFVLVAAAIQAPGSVAFWMLSYRTDELDQILQAFATGTPVLTQCGRKPLTWSEVVFELTKHFSTNEVQVLEQYQQDFAGFLRQLAREFLDPIGRREYGSLKHGMRVRPGGCRISIIPEIQPGIKDPSATAHVIEGSGFGSSFLIAERIGSQKAHYYLSHHHRHWTPASLLLQIDLIVNFAENVLKHLRLMLGSPPLTWVRPVGDNIFVECWRNDGGLLNSSFVTHIAEEAINPLSQEELRAICEAGKLP